MLLGLHDIRNKFDFERFLWPFSALHLLLLVLALSHSIPFGGVVVSGGISEQT